MRLDPDYPEHKSVYPDGAIVAHTFCFCFGAQQPKPGVFRNRRLLAVLLEKRARWIPFLVEHQDLIERPDGSLYVEGWSEWQEGNWQVAERMQRVRARKRNAGDGAYRNGSDATPRNAPLASRDARDVARAPRESASASAFDKGVSVAPTRDHDVSRKETTNGRPPGKPTLGVEDGELIARDRAILADPSTPEWKREATLTHLAGLGVHDAGGAA